jgi:glycylpeptide N-tetradecanoyltransferase
MLEVFIFLSCQLTTSRAQFGSGDGLLNFYLYNWRSKPLAGINPTEDRVAGRGVGVVML